MKFMPSVPADYRKTQNTGADQKVSLGALSVEVKGIQNLMKDVTWCRDSVERTTLEMLDLQEKIDSLKKQFKSEIDALKFQLTRVEMSLTPILDLGEQMRKTQAHLDRTLTQVENALNQ